MDGNGGPRSAAALVVLSYNGKDQLDECLRRIRAVTYRPLRTVVVDNGSTDGTADMVRSRHPFVDLVRSDHNAGVSGGRNLGVRWVEQHMTVEYVIFLDNDTRMEPDTVKELVAAAAADERIGLVAPKAFRREGDPVLFSAGGMRFNPYTGVVRDLASGEIDRGQYDEARDVQACPGFAFMVRRAVFHRVGVFDEGFNPYGWEDVDLSLRAARAGFRIVYAPKAVVYHGGGRVGRGIVDHYERHKVRNWFHLVQRNTTLLQRLCVLCVLPLRALGRLTREIAKGNHRIVGIWIRALRERD
jgi:GT2 family glycosyltransferase